MGHDIRANLLDHLNAIGAGKLLEGFEKHYHPDVVMSENGAVDPARQGKDKNRAYETYFVQNATWHDGRVLRIAVDAENNTSAYEMYMDLTFGGQRMQRTQTAFQSWKDGQIIQETFWYDTK